MITIEDLIDGRSDIYHIEKKKSYLATFIEKVVRPLESYGLELKVVHGLLRNTEVIHVNNPKLCADHTMGYGGDLTTGSRDKDIEIPDIILQLGITVTSIHVFDEYIHLAFNQEEYDMEQNEKIKAKIKAEKEAKKAAIQEELNNDE